MSCQVPSLQFALLPDVPVRPPAGYLKVYVGPDGLLYARKPNGDVRPLEFDAGPALLSIQALEPIPADMFLYTNGTNQFNESPITSFSRTILTGGSAGTWRSTLGLVIGTNVQAWSADLDSFVTNATWAGSSLTLSGQLTTVGNITSGAQLAGTSLVINGAAQFDSGLTADGNLTSNVTLVLNGELRDSTNTPGAAGDTLCSTGTATQWRQFLTIGGAGGPTITSGAGVPAAVAPEGSIYMRSSVGSIYVRESGNWVLK